MTRVGAPRTTLIDGPDGPLEVLTTGHGEPHSLFVHGLAGSISTTRPYASRVRGAKSFVHLRGHGRSHAPAPDEPWGYAELAAEVWSVADHVGAGRALGISMGAGALCRGLTEDPHRFDRLVLALPAAIDRPREDRAMMALEALAGRIEAGDREALTAHLVADQPAAVREDPAVRVWAQGQAEQLLAPGLAAVLHTLPHLVPVPDRRLLGRVSCPVLVLAQEGDETHPVGVAEELAACFRDVRLHVAGPGGIMWEHRDQTRELVGEFLSAP